MSPACWDRTHFVGTVKFTKLAPHGASCYSSKQASFQESDPFLHVSGRSAAAKQTELVVDLPESDQRVVEVDQVSASASDRDQKRPEMHPSASGIFHTYLEHTAISWPKEDASHAGFCSWICYLRSAQRDIPFFQMPQKGQKSLTVNCF